MIKEKWRIKRKKGWTWLNFNDRIIKLKISVKKHQQLSRIHKNKKKGLALYDVVKFLSHDNVADKKSNQYHKDTP